MAVLRISHFEEFVCFLVDSSSAVLNLMLIELKKSLHAVFSQFGKILEVLAFKTLKHKGQAGSFLKRSLPPPMRFVKCRDFRSTTSQWYEIS